MLVWAGAGIGVVYVCVAWCSRSPRPRQPAEWPRHPLSLCPSRPPRQTPPPPPQQLARPHQPRQPRRPPRPQWPPQPPRQPRREQPRRPPRLPNRGCAEEGSLAAGMDSLATAAGPLATAVGMSFPAAQASQAAAAATAASVARSAPHGACRGLRRARFPPRGACVLCACPCAREYRYMYVKPVHPVLPLLLCGVWAWLSGSCQLLCDTCVPPGGAGASPPGANFPLSCTAKGVMAASGAPAVPASSVTSTWSGVCGGRACGRWAWGTGPSSQYGVQHRQPYRLCQQSAAQLWHRELWRSAVS